MPVTSDDGLRGMTVLGQDGSPLGVVIDVYADQLTDRWEWALTAPDGDSDERSRRFVPLDEAEVADGLLRVPYDSALVWSAPDVGGGGHLDVDAEAELYVHYGMDPWEHGATSGRRDGGTPTGVPIPGTLIPLDDDEAHAAPPV